MSTADGKVLGATRIVDHGPDGARWNLVLLAEGYRESELGQFASDAKNFADTLFATPPVDDLRTAINIHRIDVTSTDSGADKANSCTDTTDVKTYFDATFCSDGLDRLLTVDTATVMAVVEEQVPLWDVAMVIVNSTTYGGSGAHQVPVFSLHPSAYLIGLHELGHSGFGLADEYGNRRGCGKTEREQDNQDGYDHYGGSEPVQPNITAQTGRDAIKWRHLIQPSTPLPTTTNPDCLNCPTQPNPFSSDTIGAYEGAGYYHCGLYRPQYDCRMNHLDQPYCAVCQQRIRETLTPYLPGREPMNYTVIVNSRHHFGNEPSFLPGFFSGQSRSFAFDCPAIDPGQRSVLMFESLHVTTDKNIFTINDKTIYGGLPTTVQDTHAWTSNVMLVEAGTLRPEGNSLEVEARTGSGESSGDIDDFVIDNVVLLYKTS